MCVQLFLFRNLHEILVMNVTIICITNHVYTMSVTKKERYVSNPFPSLRMNKYVYQNQSVRTYRIDICIRIPYHFYSYFGYIWSQPIFK